jgi:hypothetical protein
VRRDVPQPVASPPSAQTTRRQYAVVTRHLLAHPTSVEYPGAESRPPTRINIPVREPGNSQPLLGGEERRQVSRGNVVHQAARHHDRVRGIVDRRSGNEGITDDEPAAKALSISERLRFRDEDGVEVNADELHVRPQRGMG